MKLCGVKVLMKDESSPFGIADKVQKWQVTEFELGKEFQWNKKGI